AWSAARRSSARSGATSRPTATPCAATCTRCARPSTSRSTRPCCTPSRASDTGWRRRMNEGGLKRRLSRTFGLQAGAIAIATVLGIYLAGAILEEILITQALREEAEHHWQRHVTDPDFPLPDTHNLTGYIAPVDDLAAAPDNPRGLAPGFHDRKDTPDFSTVYVSDNRDERLYLVFDGEQVNQ